MKQVVVRLEVVEMNDHGTDVIPDEKKIFDGEVNLNEDYGYPYDSVDGLQIKADEAYQKYLLEDCEKNGHTDDYGESLIEYDTGGDYGLCARCGVEVELPEPDYDSQAKDQRMREAGEL